MGRTSSRECVALRACAPSLSVGGRWGGGAIGLQTRVPIPKDPLYSLTPLCSFVLGIAMDDYRICYLDDFEGAGERLYIQQLKPVSGRGRGSPRCEASRVEGNKGNLKTHVTVRPALTGLHERSFSNPSPSVMLMFTRVISILWPKRN